jgi:hypothetical protein
VSNAARDWQEPGTELAPTDPRLRGYLRANLERERTRRPGLRDYDAELERLDQAAAIYAPPGSPWTAPTPEEADRRWRALTDEAARVRRGLAAGRTPTDLGLRPAGEAVRRLLAERSDAGDK